MKNIKTHLYHHEKKSWTKSDLKKAVKSSFSYRQVLIKLSLKEAGGNYEQIKKYIKEYHLNSSHFRGKGWSKGLVGTSSPRRKLEDILKKGTQFQSFKLKNRLFKVGLKSAKCEICSWAKQRADGTIPVELDHTNGDRHDNRIENLRILCPNCHSLQDTHRGKNIKKNKL